MALIRLADGRVIDTNAPAAQVAQVPQFPDTMSGLLTGATGVAPSPIGFGLPGMAGPDATALPPLIPPEQVQAATALFGQAQPVTRARDVPFTTEVIPGSVQVPSPRPGGPVPALGPAAPPPAGPAAPMAPGPPSVRPPFAFQGLEAVPRFPERPPVRLDLRANGGIPGLVEEPPAFAHEAITPPPDITGKARAEPEAEFEFPDPALIERTAREAVQSAPALQPQPAEPGKPARAGNLFEALSVFGMMLSDIGLALHGKPATNLPHYLAQQVHEKSRREEIQLQVFGKLLTSDIPSVRLYAADQLSGQGLIPKLSPQLRDALGNIQFKGDDLKLLLNLVAAGLTPEQIRAQIPVDPARLAELIRLRQRNPKEFDRLLQGTGLKTATQLTEEAEKATAQTTTAKEAAATATRKRQTLEALAKQRRGETLAEAEQEAVTPERQIEAGVLARPPAQAPRLTESDTVFKAAGVDPRKPIEQLTEQEAKDVATEFQRRAEERQAAVGRGAITAKEEARLTPEELTKFVDPKTLQPLPAGTTLGQAKAIGAIELDEKAKQQLAGLGQTRELIAQLRQLSETLVTAKNPAQAFAQWVRLTLGARFKGDTDAAVYAGFRQAFLGIISRTLGAERGVLTDRDIFRIDRALPSFGDTQAIMQKKLSVIDSMFDAAVNAQLNVIRRTLTPEEAKRQMGKLTEALTRDLSGQQAPPGMKREEQPGGVPRFQRERR